MRIDVASDQDALAASTAIRRRVFVDEMGIDAVLEQDGTPADVRVFVARTGHGEAIATGRYRIKDGAVKFERIATLKAHRGIGVGRQLMECMQRDARARHPLARLVLNAQATAIPFYLKLGWQVVGEPFVEAGVAHAAMELPWG